MLVEQYVMFSVMDNVAILGLSLNKFGEQEPIGNKEHYKNPNIHHFSEVSINELAGRLFRPHMQILVFTVSVL
jgi:hypothetical protein